MTFPAAFQHLAEACLGAAGRIKNASCTSAAQWRFAAALSPCSVTSVGSPGMWPRAASPSTAAPPVQAAVVTITSCSFSRCVTSCSQTRRHHAARLIWLQCICSWQQASVYETVARQHVSLTRVCAAVKAVWNKQFRWPCQVCALYFNAHLAHRQADSH